MGAKETRVSWYEPWGFHFAKTRKTLVKAFSPAAIVRIVLASAVVVAAIVLVLRRAYPDFDWQWGGVLLKLALASSTIIPCAAIGSLVSITRITVTPSRIIVQAGARAGAFRRDPDVRCLRIRSLGFDRDVLTFRAKRKRHVYGISPRIDIAELAALLES